MSLRWGLRALAVSGALGAALAACSSDDSTATDGGSTGFLPDGAPAMLDGGAPALACKPADVSSFKADPYHAARPQPNACSPTQVTRFYTACLDPASTAATCAAFVGSDAGALDQLCAACIVSRVSDPTYGPLIKHDTWLELNVAGCLELTSASALTCAKSYQAAAECEDQACKDNCPIKASDPNSFGAYKACTNVAASIGCENFAGPAACTMQYMTGVSAVCFAGSSFQESFAGFANLFCGPREAGAPDAGTDAAAPGDAASGG